MNIGRFIQRNTHVFFIAPALIVLLLITLVPTFYNFYISVQDYSLLKPHAMSFCGMDNYIQLFTSARFWNSVRNTLIFTVVAVSIQLVYGLCTALLLNIEFRGRNFVRSILILPVFLTPIVVAFMWRIIYSPSLGILNYLLDHVLSIGGLEWASGVSTALWSLILVDVLQFSPFMMLIILAGLLSLPGEPYEAAYVDGANSWQTFWFVTFPLLKPTLIIAVLFRTIDAFKTFDIIYVMTKGGPGTATETLNIFTFLTGFSFLRMGQAAALSVIMVFLMILISQLIIKFGKVEVL